MECYPSPDDIPYPQMKFEATLVDAFLHHLDLPEPDMADVHRLFEERLLDIEVLLSSEDGRVALFPSLTKIKVAERRLTARRYEIAERLSVLFDEEVTIKDVAASQRVSGSVVKMSLVTVFRRLAEVHRSHPDLLDGPMRPFELDEIWKPFGADPRPESSPVILTDVSAAPTRTERPVKTEAPVGLRRGMGEVGSQLEEVLQELRVPEQETIILLLGLDGNGQKNPKEVARRLNVAERTVQRRAGRALHKLKLAGGMTLLQNYCRALLERSASVK